MRDKRRNIPDGPQKVAITELYAFKIVPLWRAMRQEHIAFWMLCLYFMFEYVRPQSLYPSIDVLPWPQLALLGSIVTAYMDPHSKWTANPINNLMIAFTIVIVLSGVFAFMPQASLGYWNAFGGWVIIFFVTTSVVNTEQRLVLFLIAYCLFSLKMAQHGAIGWAGRGFSFAGHGLVGAPGWFRNSGEYAIQMLIYGSLALSMVAALQQYWSKYKRIFLIVLGVMGYMAVMGASSRGAQIALAVIGIWMMLKLENGLKGLLVICVIALLLYYFLPEQQMERFREIGEDRNSLQRLAYWIYAIENVIPEYPVLGLGYYNWMAYLSFMVPEGMGPMRINQQVHNIYLQAITELGVIGLLVFLATIVTSFVVNMRTRKYARALENNLLYYVSHGLDAGMIGFLVSGTFVTVLWYPFFWIQLTMIAVLNNVARRLHDERFSAQQRPGRRSGRALKAQSGDIENSEGT